MPGWHGVDSAEWSHDVLSMHQHVDEWVKQAAERSPTCRGSGVSELLDERGRLKAACLLAGHVGGHAVEVAAGFDRSLDQPSRSVSRGEREVGDDVVHGPVRAHAIRLCAIDFRGVGRQSETVGSGVGSNLEGDADG